jgi:ACS family glucarate transporter-like MFS transporter
MGGLTIARRWRLVAPALLLLWMIGQVDKTHISLIVADHAFLQELDLGGHNPALGGLMSAFFVGYGLAIFVWGFVVDRFGPRRSALAGALCWGAVLFLSSHVAGIKEYLLIRFLLGAAEGNLWPVSNTLTNRWFPASEHSRVQTFWITGVTLGTAIGVPIVTALILASGWRGALAWLSLLSLLPVALFLFVGDWPDERREIEHDRRIVRTDERLSFYDLFTSTPFWLITLCQVTSATTIYTLIQWLPSYLTAFAHLSFASMGGWITAGYFLATLVTLVVGYIADRTMRRALTAAAVSLGFAVLILPAAQGLPPAISAVVLASLISVPSSTAALNGALMHALVRPEAIARGTGVYVGIGNVASAAGPTIFGVLINALGGQYWGGFAFLAVLNGLGAACYVALHRCSTRA